MKMIAIAAPIAVSALALASSTAAGSPRTAVSGDYVEARSAEVFTGGCTMNSEAETMGREAVAAWRVSHGAIEGVPVEGLAVVAALAGDRNLGMREMGGEAPTRVRAMIYVDERASGAQRAALVSLVRMATGDLLTEVTQVMAVPIRFERTPGRIEVEAGDARLSIEAHVHHDPNCGAMQWFMPLGDMTRPSLGLTRTHMYWGLALGTRWRQHDRKSSFWGPFEIETVSAVSSQP